MYHKNLFGFSNKQLCCGRYRFKDHLFLNTLSSLLEVIYTDSEGHKDLVSLSTIHMMTSTHSLFLPTMLDCGEEPNYSSKGMTGMGLNFTLHHTLSLHFDRQIQICCPCRSIGVFTSLFGEEMSSSLYQQSFCCTFGSVWSNVEYFR